MTVVGDGRHCLPKELDDEQLTPTQAQVRWVPLTLVIPARWTEKTGPVGLVNQRLGPVQEQLLLKSGRSKVQMSAYGGEEEMVNCY